MNAKVDAFLSKAGKWRDEFTQLRAIILDGKGLDWTINPTAYRWLS